MLNSSSVKTRLLVSIGANVLRSIIGFFSGLLVAHQLNPSGYGDLMFLLGSFTAIKGLLDMGTASAFYTFLSRHSQGRKFYLLYVFWLILQFLITLALLALIIPANVFEQIWLGHSREIVIIAFLAVFMQQQVLQTLSQIGESMRKTVKLQLLTLLFAMVYLAALSILSRLGVMTQKNILFAMIFQYVLTSIAIYWMLRGTHPVPSQPAHSVKEIVLEYWKYCKPLIMLSLVTFLYDFADKWMLQKFGGATQQGFFQIANQFSNVMLLATMSIINILWKEMAEAWGKGDHSRIAMLYRKSTRSLVMLSAIASGLVFPWTEQIVLFLLGANYAESWSVLAIMLLYPIHLPMGVIGGSTLLAIGQTHKHMLICVIAMLLSMPIAYLMLAPVTAGGLAFGALGLAIKLVSLNVISTNIQAWVIARYNGWKFDWLFQVVGIPLMIALGYLLKLLAGLFWNLHDTHITNMILPVLLTGVLYTSLVILTIWLLPWLIGLERNEIKKIFIPLGIQMKSLLGLG